MNKLISPILKWVGGKRQILSEIRKYIPQNYSTYYEPFVGGGAVLFDIQPQKAIINDINGDLINVYNVVKYGVDSLIRELKHYKNESDYFYKVRAWDRQSMYESISPIVAASRIIYLNKTCFNGLYRVNNAGQFNSPFGRYKNPNIVNESGLRAVSEYFNTTEIKFTCVDFEKALSGIESTAFVYLDPPYDPVSDTSNFTGYSQNGFNRNDQIRLKQECDRLTKKGVMFLLSNAATPFILDLYKDYNIKIVQAKRTINSKADKRGLVDEVLIMNYYEEAKKGDEII
jgi:DNA adenine methylase